MIFGKIKELYFVGIGGSGMSGIAEILFNLGYKISGSDIYSTEITDRLQSLGIMVYDRHDPENIGAANVVVISSAVGEDNPEVIEARKRGIAVIKRAEMLGELMRLKYSIGIAGTHGKTTVTSMIGKILADAGLDPTVIVGGIVAGRGTGASLGSGDYLVAEADEFDRSFMAMFPSMAVVTNIEAEHLDSYTGLEDLENCFVDYMNRVPFYGLVVYSADDPILKKLKARITRTAVSFGLEPGADYRANDITFGEGFSKFAVHKEETKLGEVHLNIPGQHNIYNALSAIASACELEIPFDTIADSLMKFKGVSRRFEIKELVENILVIDDYAHHPTEIAATIDTARSYNRRLIVIYQPHLYSRTKQFYKEFAEVLHYADITLLVDIHPAREKPIEGVTSEMIARHSRNLGYDNVRYIGAGEEAVREVTKIARSGDMIMTVGAGSVTLLAPRIIKSLKEK
jgi:UDP-N-acetylmuramate--alanine ligase